MLFSSHSPPCPAHLCWKSPKPHCAQGVLVQCWHPRLFSQKNSCLFTSSAAHLSAHTHLAAACSYPLSFLYSVVFCEGRLSATVYCNPSEPGHGGVALRTVLPFMGALLSAWDWSHWDNKEKQTPLTQFANSPSPASPPAEGCAHHVSPSPSENQTDLEGCYCGTGWGIWEMCCRLLETCLRPWGSHAGRV